MHVGHRWSCVSINCKGEVELPGTCFCGVWGCRVRVQALTLLRSRASGLGVDGGGLKFKVKVNRLGGPPTQ